MLPRSCMQTHKDCLNAEKAEAITGKRRITDNSNPEGNGPPHSMKRGRRRSTGPPQPERRQHHRVHPLAGPSSRSTQGPRPWLGHIQRPKESGVGINLGEISVLGVTSATDTPATGLFCTVGSPTQESCSQQITTESGIDLSCPLVK